MVGSTEKFIVMLRDPVMRAASAYNHYIRATLLGFDWGQDTNESFRDVITRELREWDHIGEYAEQHPIETERYGRYQVYRSQIDAEAMPYSTVGLYSEQLELWFRLISPYVAWLALFDNCTVC
jgi:hypothetical protein